jgi:hypothetical protein
VATITAANDEGIRLTPKLSPIKYRNGSKKASKRKLLTSDLFNGFNLLSEIVNMKRKTLEITSLKRTRVMGL